MRHDVMLRAVGAILFFAAYIGMIVAVWHLPPEYRNSAALLVLLIGFLGVAGWVIAPHRKRW